MDVASPSECICTKLTTWTTEQQVQEFIRRITCVINQNFSYSPRPTDIIINTAPKSGTTWVSHICHQLRTNGAEPDFEDQVPEVVTFLEGSDVFVKDPNTAIQPADPRIYATHVNYEKVPKKGRYIYCFRDLKDVLYSYYVFLDSLLILNGRVSLPTFMDVVVNKRGFTANSQHNLLAWWDRRHDEDVLLLFYEDLVDDHVGSVRRIARFMGVNCDDETIGRVVRTTTHAAMTEHHSKFDLHSVILQLARQWGEDPPSEFVGRVRKGGGKPGDGRKLPFDVQRRLDEEWHDIITSKLGFNNLQEMRDAWKKERN